MYVHVFTYKYKIVCIAKKSANQSVAEKWNLSRQTSADAWKSENMHSCRRVVVYKFVSVSREIQKYRKIARVHT